MDHQTILTVSSIILAVIAFARERSKSAALNELKRLDVAREFGPMLLERVKQLEKNEKESRQREETARVRGDKVLNEAANWQRKFELLEREYALLREQLEIQKGHFANLQQENQLLREEREQLKTEREQLRRIIERLEAELDNLHRRLGVARDAHAHRDTDPP